MIASAGFDRKIFLWNVYGECENWTILMGHTGAIMDLKYNYDGRLASFNRILYASNLILSLKFNSELITCATDKSILIWDLNSCEKIKKYKTHKNYVNCVDASRQNPHFICSGSDDNNIKVNF